MDREDRRRRGSLAALPAWAVGKFTASQAAVMRAAAAAGVGIGTAREALMIADTIGLVTVEHLRGFYDIRSRSPEWLSALRDTMSASTA